jgi:hypothetical protein
MFIPLTLPILRKQYAPCSRRNISLVPFEDAQFGLALRPARCKFGKIRVESLNKLSNFAAARTAPRSAGYLLMRSLLILVAICFSATAFAQSAPPKIGNKRLIQVKPKEPMGCKLVGTVRRTKLWAGDCVGSELGGSPTRTETQALPEEATGAITPDQKE